MQNKKYLRISLVKRFLVNVACPNASFQIQKWIFPKKPSINNLKYFKFLKFNKKYCLISKYLCTLNHDKPTIADEKKFRCQYDFLTQILENG